MTTLAQFRAAVQAKLQDEGGIYWSASSVDGHVNEALLRLYKDTQLGRDLWESNVGLVPGDNTIELEAAIGLPVLDIIRVWLDGEQLEYLTGDQVAAVELNGAGSVLYYSRQTTGFNAIRLHTVPDTGILGSFRIEYVAGPPVLVEDADEVDLSYQYVDAVVDGALALALAEDVPAAQRERSGVYESKYVAKAGQASALVSAGFQTKPAGSRRQSRIPRM
jgi:hypothetical protein